MIEDAFVEELTKWIEKETTYEDYGYYGPLIYTDPLLNEIHRLVKKHSVDKKLHRNRSKTGIL